MRQFLAHACYYVGYFLERVISQWGWLDNWFHPYQKLFEWSFKFDREGEVWGPIIP